MQRRGFIAALGAPVFHGGNGKARVYRVVAAAQMQAFLQCESDTAVVEVRWYEGSIVTARDALAFQLGFGMGVIDRR